LGSFHSLFFPLYTVGWAVATLAQLGMVFKSGRLFVWRLSLAM